MLSILLALCVCLLVCVWHYGDVIMGTIASEFTSLKIVYSSVYSDADQRKHQSSASLAFVRGIHRGPVNSPHKWPVTRKMFPFDDVIMSQGISPVTVEFSRWQYMLHTRITRHTLRPRQKATISQTTFPDIFCNESAWISIKISLNFSLRAQLTIFQHWFI